MRYPLVILLTFFLNALHLSGQTLPVGFSISKIADDLNPVAMVIDPFGRYWIAEKDGKVKIVEEGKDNFHLFIDLAVDDFNERGLMGIALHPNYVQNGYVYLYFTVPDKNFNRVIRVSSNGDSALPGSEKTIIDLDSLSGNIHNGGAMVFDDHGYLFIATGEGGKSSDAQNLNSLNGKILRLDANGIIPSDNPFYNELSGNNKAIYAYGLRNPFSMTFDMKTHTLFVSDVGQGLFEEINIINKGKNYGWPFAEGNYTNNPPPNYEDPFFAYDHNIGCAIVGAAVNTNEFNNFPEPYKNAFYFADYCKGFIKLIDLNNKEITDFSIGTDRPLAIHFDATGDLFLLTRSGIGGGSSADNTKTNDGALWHIRYNGNGIPNISSQSNNTTVPVGDNVTLSVNATGSQPLHYLWYKNDVLVPDEFTSSVTLKNIQLSSDNSKIKCIVSNLEGSDTSNVIFLNVTTNKRPEPFILAPFTDVMFKCGDTIFFSGRAIDDGLVMGEEAIRWEINQHHDSHSHPFLNDLCCVSASSFVVPSTSETSSNVWLRITMNATDSSGLTGSYFIDLYPDQTVIKINGPTGTRINVDGTYYTLPAEIKSTKGIHRILNAIPYQEARDSVFVFQQWENGNDESLRPFITPNDTSFVEVHLKAYALGFGSGLKGEYFNDPEFDLDGIPDFETIDTIINFNWGNTAPTQNLDPDDFTVRWTGHVQSVFDEEYTFYTFSDDGVRLYINDTLIIDEWHNQSVREHSGKYRFQAEKKYRIRLEYMEVKSGALVNLKWSSLHTPKQLVPKRQLYLAAPPARILGEAFIDENKNDFFDVTEQPIANMPIILYDQKNKINSISYSNENGFFILPDIDSGQYKIQFNAAIINDKLIGNGAINELGFTPLFRLDPSQTKSINAPFITLSTNVKEEDNDPIKLYPNPFYSKFHLDSKKTIQEIEIFDTKNQMVFEEHKPSAIITPNLVPGLYLLKIISNDTVEYKNIICIK